MRLLLGQLAPAPGEVETNVARIAAAVRAERSDLAIFPELFLSGYRVGDRFHALAVRDGDATLAQLRAVAREARTTIVVGAPLAGRGRAGELANAAVAIRPDGEVHTQVKRYLPNFGPFEEGVHFTPTEESAPVPLAGHSIGLEICYDVFFPEVARSLALAGAELLVVLSASPVTSGRLFARLLPARAIENAVPVVFVNRVGVEDGAVFGGGSGIWDARGEVVATRTVPFGGGPPEEALLYAEVDLAEAARWRPFRPVLRDLATRPTTASPG
jgi:predicted amidohydrolase